MSRYDNIKKYRTETGTVYLGVTKYPQVPYSEDDIYVYVTVGDRLDNLAYQYYRDSTLYWLILAANPNLTYNLMYPLPGAQMRIPFPVDSIINSYNRLNNG